METKIMKEEYLQIITTAEKKEEAERIAEVLLERRLAGCIQIIGPITSRYWWKDKIEKTEECLSLIKTKKNLYAEVEKSIRKIHPYKTPEIISMPVVIGSKDYLKWLDDEIKK